MTKMLATLKATKQIEHGFFRRFFCVKISKLNIQLTVPIPIKIVPPYRYRFVCAKAHDATMPADEDINIVLVRQVSVERVE
jgi:hypothetical protein